MGDVTIVEFLTARIAEREADARAASIGSESWRLGEYDETILWWPPASPEKVAFIRERLGDAVAERDASWRGQTIETAGDRIAPHIVRHDPARELRRCEADRRIVERHTGKHHCPEPEDDEWATWYIAGEPVTIARPCGDLRDLAAPDADHPDYREEWRP